MNSQPPITKETVVNAPVSKVWQAFTDKETMKKWYFDVDGFEPEIGFHFVFYGGDEQQYEHHATITEVIPERKLAHTWSYTGEPVCTHVTFDFMPEGPNRTRVKVTHVGVHNFPKEKPEFAYENFVQGWSEIIGTNLPRFIEQ